MVKCLHYFQTKSIPQDAWLDEITKENDKNYENSVYDSLCHAVHIKFRPSNAIRVKMSSNQRFYYFRSVDCMKNVIPSSNKKCRVVLHM